MPSQSSSVPPIRSFQFDATAVAGVQSSVNLFRGDVNLTLPLFTMPGRVEGQGMDVNVTLLYQSNVYEQATTWNLDAPTSIVGLGCSLPVGAISRDEPAGGSLAAPTYSYSGNGAGGALVREPDTPFLFSAAAADVGTPIAGAVVPTTLVAAFGAMGLALAATSVFAADDRPGVVLGAWLVDDDENQQQFSLRPVGEAWAVHAGGESYQLESYDFSRILYYPDWERWVVTGTSGTTSSFGGLVATPAGEPRAAVGNSIEWGVAWQSSSSAAPQWTGPSAITAGQVQFARVWHLAVVSNLWGDAVRYAYNQQWPKDPVTGVAPVVEQLVQAPLASGGKPYTKACYLTTITDVFGRTATFVYADKLWSPDAEAPREYADPHKEVPDNSPNAWQDRYETQYLERVVVRDLDGRTLFSVELGYDPRPEAGAASAVANVTSSTGALEGDTFKRYLTAIQRKNGAGQARPATELTYWLEPPPSQQPSSQETGPSPGALRSMTTPEGATSSWSYTLQSLAVCERSQTVSPPASFPATDSLTPRVWFGDDYAVACWYDLTANQLSLEIWSWSGRWISWQPAWGPVLFASAAGLDLSSLQVSATEHYLALSFDGGPNGDRQVYLFNRDDARPGIWEPATVDGVTTGYNQPTLSYATDQGPVGLVAGSTFFLVSQMGITSFAYDRVWWSWATREWRRETISLGGQTWLVAAAEYYLTLDGDGQADLFVLAPTLSWQAGGSILVPANLAMTPSSSVALVPGSGMVVVSVLTSPAGSSTLSYTLYPLRWDASYQFDAATAPAYPYSDPVDPSSPTTWVPSLVDDTLIACSAHLLRWNGASWLANDSLLVRSPQGLQQRFAYGPDYAVRITVNDTGTSTAEVLPFDADTSSTSWSTTLPVTPDASSLDLDSYPTAGSGDYLSIGQYLYFRGSATNWGEVVANGTPSDLESLVDQAGGGTALILDTASVINEGPAFVAFNTSDEATGARVETAVVLLKNGQPTAAPSTLAGEWLTSVAQSDAADPGVAPAGGGAFVTYPATAQGFTTATSFELHRFAANAVEGNLMHFAVTSFTADDGMGNDSSRVMTAIVPVPQQAACDASGSVVQYYESIVCPATPPGPDPGGSPPASPLYGSVVVNYLNGLEEVTGESYYRAMDGLLSNVEVRDRSGNTLSAASFTWEAFTRRSPDPSNPQAPPEHLNGAFVVRTAVDRVVDGVESRSETSYVDVARGFVAPWSAQPVLQVERSWGSTGSEETTTTATAYACQFTTGASHRALNLLSAAVQSLARWAEAGGEPVATQVSATTWSSWPTALGAGVVVPAAEASFAWQGGASPDFPFDSYLPGEIPAGWQLATGRVLERLPQGLISEGEDALGIVTSVLYQSFETLPVAQVQNASLAAGAWTYAGFEPYEQPVGWTASGALPLVGDAYTGTASLELPAGQSSSLTVTVQAATGGETYVLGWALKTPAGFSPAAGDGWTVSISSPGGAQAPVTRELAATAGRWQFFTLGIPLPAGQGPFTITATATSSGSAAVLLDGVSLAPLLSQLVAQTFDLATGLPTSSASHQGRQSITAYDGFAQPVVTTAADGAVVELGQSALSRQSNPAGAFDPTFPNATLSLSPAAGGELETFTTGDEWQLRWQASAAATNWRVVDGALLHVASTADTLAWLGWQGEAPETVAPETVAPETAALYFEVLAGAEIGAELGVELGGGYFLGWSPAGGGQWSFTQAGATVAAPLSSPPGPAAEWLLVFGNGVLVFFAGGQLVWSVAMATAGLAATATIATGANQVAFKNLAMMASPRLSLSFLDGAGRTLQTQNLVGADAVLSASIVDPLGRSLAVTKSAPASFGMDASLPLLTYHPRFADRDAFLANTASSWVLPGDVSDYYRGQVEGGVARSDDEGYSYSGCRYEASVRRRRLEAGLPGKRYAIHDVDTTSPAERATTQFSYGANPAQGEIPADTYRTKSTTNPLKSVTTQVTSIGGQQVESTTADPAGAQTTKTRSSWTFAADEDSAGSLQTVELPNFFTTAPQADPSGFVRTVASNPLGLETSSTGPNTGTTASLYDQLGRVRFVQPALDPGEIGFFYTKYDALGRLTEQGTVPMAWDEATLQPLADRPDWPDSTVATSVCRAFSYDGDGNLPQAIGQRTAVVTTTAAPTNFVPGAQPIVTTETATFDRRGRVASVTLATSVPGAPAGTLRYQYNNLSDLTALDYPVGSPVARVIYGFDELGQIQSIGSSEQSPADYASYTFTPDGGVATASLGDGKLAATFTAASPDWLQEQAVTVAGAAAPAWSLAYTYRPDATIEAATEVSAFASPSSTVTTGYAYDSLRRLTGATVTGSGSGNAEITSYDANGNLWQATADGTAASYTSSPGQDRLATVEIGGQGPLAVVYDAAGRLVAVGHLAVAYDPALSRPAGFQVAGANPRQLQLGYNGQGQRSAKLVTGTGATQLAYFCGLGSRPQVVVENGVWTAYVYGPTGTVAIVQASRFFPLQDQQQTLRAMVDDNGELVASFAYRVFGTPLGVTGSAAGVTPYRYMGQEWDRETALYNFVTRTYNPLLCRYHEPDPSGQFPSPYVFVGNNPVSMVDPDGATAHWGTIAAIGIGVAMATVTVAGMFFTPETGGASDAVAAELDADLELTEDVLDAGDVVEATEPNPAGGGGGDPQAGQGQDVVHVGAGNQPAADPQQVWGALDQNPMPNEKGNDMLGRRAGLSNKDQKALRNNKIFESASTMHDDQQVTKVGKSKRGAPGRSSLSANVADRLRAYGIQLPDQSLEEKFPLGNCGMQRALAKLGGEVGDLSQKQILVTRGGLKGGNAKLYASYVSPCRNCAEILNLNPNITAVAPDHLGIPVGLGPNMAVKPPGW